MLSPDSIRRNGSSLRHPLPADLPAYIDCQFIGHFENFDRDLATLSGMLNIDLNRYAARIDPHRTGVKDFERYFDAKSVEFVRIRYRDDFRHFGYPMDLPG